MKLITNARVLTPTTVFDPGAVTVEGERIHAVGAQQDVAVSPEAEVIDAGGRAVVPGFVDTHFYGCGGIAPTAGSGQTLTDLDTIGEGLARIAALLPRWDTTSF